MKHAVLPFALLVSVLFDGCGGGRGPALPDTAPGPDARGPVEVWWPLGDGAAGDAPGGDTAADDAQRDGAAPSDTPRAADGARVHDGPAADGPWDAPGAELPADAVPPSDAALTDSRGDAAPDAPVGRDGVLPDLSEADVDFDDAPTAVCVAGAVECPTSTSLRRCVAGQWSPDEPCPPDAVCSPAGRACLTPCAAAAERMSNTGCGFWLVELANNGNEGYDGAVPEPRWTAGAQVFVVNPNARAVMLSLADREGPLDLGENATVAAGATALIALPVVAAGSRANRYAVAGSTLGYTALHLASDLPIVAYQFNPAQRNIASFDASLLHPEHALGGQYMGLTVAHSLKRVDGLLAHRPGRLTIVATAADTVVTVTPTAATSALVVLPEDLRASAETHDLSALVAGVARTFRLQPFEVLQLESTADPADCPLTKTAIPEHGSICIDADNGVTGVWCNVYGRTFCQPGADLSGTRIEATAPVAVFGGSSHAAVPYWMFGTEHLEEQLPPVDRWGTRYLLTRIEPRYRYYTCSRGNGLGTHDSTCPFGSGVTFFKVLAAAPDTVVRIHTPLAPVTVTEAPREFNYHHQTDWTTRVVTVGGLPCTVEGDLCVVSLTLQAGQTFAFNDVFAHVVEASAPVLVGRFIPGEEYVGIPFSDAPGPYELTLQYKGGDPSFSLVVPLDQYRAEYTFYVPGELRYGYANVALRTGDSLVLDEGTPNERLIGPDDAAFEALTGLYRTRIYEIHNLSPYDPPRELPGAPYSAVLDGGGAHTVRSTSGSPFGIEVYGFDHYVSYMYPGGADLRPISQVTWR